ncbi:MAG TPA: FAD-dependent oxidoreductase [Candidatus Acidoferrum sp.]|nr:FAD-dependent oxidoreductase [Candidatus Acidoferrum sp.]
MSSPREHFVAVIGAAISGSVAAEVLAEHGIRVAVFEQNARPYGKIEDGLPRWHVEQRKQEYARIDARLRKPGVDFIPCTKLGRDIDFLDLSKNWGFSAVILANGAWRDRDLGVAGANECVGTGLVYQNSFIYWYNHKNERGYTGPRYETPDGAIVVGGGLASIDVVKALQLESYERALRTRGIETNVHELEKGIPAVCKEHGIRPEDLGVEGCLLIYRRREQDMPLAQPPDNATPDQIAKTEQVRQKMLRLAREKYLFRFQDRRVTTGVVVENGRLVGLKVVETKINGRSAEPVPGTEYEIRAPLVVSSIGSVPERVPGIAMKGEYYAFADEPTPRHVEHQHVFGVGNVVTGQGNIRVSLVHSKAVCKKLIDNYARTSIDNETVAATRASAEQSAATKAASVIARVESWPPLRPDQMAEIERRIHAVQQRVGYTGDYDTWIAKVTPPDLE